MTRAPVRSRTREPSGGESTPAPKTALARPRSCSWILALSLTVACSDGGNGSAVFDTHEGPEDPSGSSTAAEDENLDSSSSSTDPSRAPGAGIDPDGSVGCDAVDFLFVIDNSGSMADEQQQLIESVPGFVAAIEARLPAGTGTYHIMECNFGSGRRYIASGEPDLAGAFDCAARVGTNSSLGEKPMEAMVQALTGSGDVAACNQGFLRDDAVLVVVIITDEDDNGPNADDLEGDSVGTPSSWKDALVEAKHGNENAIITMALIGDADSPTGICAPLPATFEGAEPAPRIRDFAESFGAQGVVGSVCAPSYVEFFESAVETISMACDEFVPAG